MAWSWFVGVVWLRASSATNIFAKEGTYGQGKVRVYEELTPDKVVVDLSPPQALDRAERFLAGQGYVVAQRTATTLTVTRKGSEFRLFLPRFLSRNGCRNAWQTVVP